MSASASPIPAPHPEPEGPVTVFDGQRKEPYRISVCGHDHLHVELLNKKGAVHSELEFRKPEDIWDFAQGLLRGYDKIVGI